MKVFLVSNIPISSLREKYSSGPPADFVIEDLVEVASLNDTCYVDELEIALSKMNRNKAKFLYEINIKEIK